VNRNQLIIAVVAILIIIAAAVGYYVFFPSQTTTGAIPESAGGPGYTLTADDRTQGSRNAPVVMIEYAAPTCPHCAHFNETVFPFLKQNYIQTGKVYYVFRVFPLHPTDGAAEAMARCLPADNYFEFIDLLFRNQAKWDWEYGVTDLHGALVNMGRLAGMTPERVDSCIGDKAMQEHINKVAMDGQTRYNISGTPTFIVNGVVHQAPEMGTPADVQAILDAALKAKK